MEETTIGGYGVATEDLKHELRSRATRNGAVLFGVADLTPATDFIVAQGGPMLARFPRAISVGIPVTRALVEGLADKGDAGAASHYHYHVYEVVNRQLQIITLDLANQLDQLGYAAYPIPASLSVDQTRLLGLFSQKLAAHLGGLAFIGKSCIAVVPAYGGRVRFATVLTDAPLGTDAPGVGRCGDCRACVDACPVQAITNVEFRPEDPREVRLRADVCARYMDYREKTIGKRVCGQCVLACDGQRGEYARPGV